MVCTWQSPNWRIPCSIGIDIVGWVLLRSWFEGEFDGTPDFSTPCHNYERKQYTSRNVHSLQFTLVINQDYWCNRVSCTFRVLSVIKNIWNFIGVRIKDFLLPLCGIFQKASAQDGSRIAGPLAEGGTKPEPMSVLAACSTAGSLERPPGAGTPWPAAGRDVAPSVTAVTHTKNF